jgi:hypothetical protein
MLALKLSNGDELRCCLQEDSFAAGHPVSAGWRLAFVTPHDEAMSGLDAAQYPHIHYLSLPPLCFFLSSIRLLPEPLT